MNFNALVSKSSPTSTHKGVFNRVVKYFTCNYWWSNTTISMWYQCFVLRPNHLSPLCSVGIATSMLQLITFYMLFWCSNSISSVLFIGIILLFIFPFNMKIKLIIAAEASIPWTVDTSYNCMHLFVYENNIYLSLINFITPANRSLKALVCFTFCNTEIHVEYWSRSVGCPIKNTLKKVGRKINLKSSFWRAFGANLHKTANYIHF